MAADVAELGELRVRAASVVGRGHQQAARPRQDAYRIGAAGAGRYLVAALADGVSDSRHAEFGAAVAVQAATEMLAEVLPAGAPPGELLRDGLSRRIFAGVAERVMLAASRQGMSPSQVSAVFITAVVEARMRSDGTRRARISWVGDATAWLLYGAAWSLLAGDDKSGTGGPVSNEVRAVLPQHPDRVRDVVCDLPPGGVLVLVSDGVGEALSDPSGVAREYFAGRWSRPPTIARFLNDLSYEAPTYIDDRTAVVVWT